MYVYNLLTSVIMCVQFVHSIMERKLCLHVQSLLQACDNGDVRKVQQLLRTRVDVDCQDKVLYTQA